jgi:hypothetical protein
MNWETLQQLLRIILYAVGGYFLGDGVTQGAEFQAAVGGVLAVGAFVWWAVWERKRTDGATSVVGGLIFAATAYLGLSAAPGSAEALFGVCLLAIAVWLLATWRLRHQLVHR